MEPKGWIILVVVMVLLTAVYITMRRLLDHDHYWPWTLRLLASDQTRGFTAHDVRREVEYRPTGAHPTLRVAYRLLLFAQRAGYATIGYVATESRYSYRFTITQAGLEALRAEEAK